jgi:D-lactate dehydrogenase
MKVIVFSNKPYDQTHLDKFNQNRHQLTFISARLTAQTSSLGKGYDGVCCFVNDELDEECIHLLAKQGIKHIVMRCAGYNNVSLETCEKYGINVARVPEYSPYAVAEHAIALIMNLNRNIHRAFSRVRENYYLLDGLLGFDMHGKTVGVIGTGKIGICLINILLGFGCKVVAYDLFENDEVKN